MCPDGKGTPNGAATALSVSLAIKTYSRVNVITVTCVAVHTYCVSVRVHFEKVSSLAGL